MESSASIEPLYLEMGLKHQSQTTGEKLYIGKFKTWIFSGVHQSLLEW